MYCVFLVTFSHLFRGFVTSKVCTLNRFVRPVFLAIKRISELWLQSENGLHYNWHRHYDPALGRYTQADPLGFGNGPSVYAYALNSPQMYTGPDGRVVWFAPILAGAAIGGGLDLAFQLYREDGDFGCVNWASVTETAALGALGGGVGVGLVRSSGRLYLLWRSSEFQSLSTDWF